MVLLLALAAMPLPTASDVQDIEEARVLELLVDYDRQGRQFVEFAPTVQTREAACVAHEDGAECTYESRVRDFFGTQFTPWEKRRERLVWRTKCWVRLP